MRAAVEIWDVFRAVENDHVQRWAVILEDIDWRPIGLFFEVKADAERACRDLGLEVVDRDESE